MSNWVWEVLSGEAQTLEMVLPFANASDFFDNADLAASPNGGIERMNELLQNLRDCMDLNNSVWIFGHF